MLLDWLRPLLRRTPRRRPGGAVAGWPEERTDTAGILFSAGVHLLAVILILISPFIGARSPVLPEVYQVELVNVAEYHPPAPKTVKVKASPKPVKKVRVATSPPPAAPSAVSLNPIRSRLLKEARRLEEAERLQLAARLERLRREAEAERKRELARKKASQAVSALAESLRAGQAEIESASDADAAPAQPEPDEARTAEKPEDAGAARPGGEGVASAMSAAYLSRLGAIIQRNWILPDLQKKWPRSMQARIKVAIGADGRITGLTFLKRAGDFRFNVQAEKALRKSAPFPPPPPEIADEAREIVLTFTPEEVR